MDIACLHTAQVHVATFDRIFAQIDPSVRLLHCVEPDLLARARIGGLDEVRGITSQLLQQLARADAVLCTCSTLGPIADEARAAHDHVLRIDRPMMEQACQIGADIVVAICLASAEAATLALLQDCARDMGRVISPRVVPCSDAWPCFEAGDMDGFAHSITQAVAADVAANPSTDCIVLAQASMQAAEQGLVAGSIPVLSSPVLAAQRAVEVAKARL